MLKIQQNILSEFPKGSVSEIKFEGSKIVVYVNKKELFIKGFEIGKKLAQKYKKRIEIRVDPSLIPNEEEIVNKIKEIVPNEAELTNIFLEKHLSTVTIEVKRPEFINLDIINLLRIETLCSIKVKRAPLKTSKIVDTIRAVLHRSSDYRSKFLHEVGKKILSGIYEKSRRDWIRISILGSGREVGRSCLLLQTPESNVLLDCGVGISPTGSDSYPIINLPEFDIDTLDAVIITHSHLDHSGFVPFLFRMGWKGPIYMTEPTRDLTALVLLDYEKVSVKQHKEKLFTSKEIQEVIKHSISINYEEVTDITPDIRLSFYNAGHILGSAMVHLNIGNGKHNILYTGDLKYAPSRLLDKPKTTFLRLETLIMESTYGGKQDFHPSREEVEKEFLNDIKKTITEGGKVLIPVLAVGRAQEIILLLLEAIRNKEIPEVNLYLEGILWETSMIHTAYPEFLSKDIRESIISGNNPFESELIVRASAKERKDIIESSEPCIVVATSGMMNGGPIVDYFKYAANDERNLLALVSYQARGTLGRRLLEGERELVLNEEHIKVNLKIKKYDGFSGHADRRELLKFVSKLKPKPKQVLVVHGEPPKPFELSYSIKKKFNIESYVPKNADAVRVD